MRVTEHTNEHARLAFLNAWISARIGTAMQFAELSIAERYAHTLDACTRVPYATRYVLTNNEE